MTRVVRQPREIPLTSSTVLAEPTPRLDALTGLRWWAAFVVFLDHMHAFAALPLPSPSVLDYGYLGVTFFFVLSGFVLTWSARPDVPVSTFYWRRFARIWPAHMVALILAIPVFYSFGPIPEGSFLKPFDLVIILLSVVLLQAWFREPLIIFSGNPAAWTLTCEAFFYALHPAISRVLVRWAIRGALLLGAAAVASAFAYRLAVILWPASVPWVPLPVERLPEFVLGMALAWAMRNGWRPRIHPVIGVGAMAGLIGFLALASAGSFSAVPVVRALPAFTNELFTVACALAILALASYTLRGGRSFFESRLQVRLGEWSFAFYLVHATFIYLALRIFGYQEASWLNLVWFAVLLAVNLVAAWALHSFVERPLEKRMRRWKDRRDKARLASVVSA